MPGEKIYKSSNSLGKSALSFVCHFFSIPNVERRVRSPFPQLNLEVVCHDRIIKKEKG
jgi:hypothetical protein